MIKFQATATIHSISPVIEIPSKTGGQSFQKRELILDDSWEKDGQRYANFVLVEFSGDRMSVLDSFAPGQRVSVEGMINGREYNGWYFNTVRGLSVTPFQPQQAQGYRQGAPLPQQQPVQAYPQQQPSEWIVPGVHRTAHPHEPPVATGYPPMPGGNNHGGYGY